MLTMNSRMILVFTIDERYLPHLAAALMSFIQHNDPSRVQIGLVHRDIDQSMLDQFVLFFASKDLEIVTRKVENFLGDVPVGYHFNEVIFYRLLAPELFSDYEKILYIDSDIIFLQSILGLFEINLNDSVLAAVEKTNFSGVPAHLNQILERYFASGLLLIDTRRFIELSIKEKCIKFLASHRYEMPDQDALSFAVHDFISIDPSYSVETAFLGKTEKLYDFAKSPKIVQFSGSCKPWHMNNRHPYKRLYWHYRNQTPFKSLFPDDFSLLNVARYIVPNFAKRFVKKIIGIKLN